jgi:hypothetical protein
MDEPIEKIISCGQTGVDRAALDVAMELGIPCGGGGARRLEGGGRTDSGALSPAEGLFERIYGADPAERIQLKIAFRLTGKNGPSLPA